MVYEPQSTPRLLVNNMSFRLESICVVYRATRIRFNGFHRTVFMLCRVQGIAQRARRAWIQAAAFFCWLASAAASSGPPSVSNRDSQTRDERLSSCVVQLVLCESRACSASARKLKARTLQWCERLTKLIGRCAARNESTLLPPSLVPVPRLPRPREGGRGEAS